MTHLEILKEKYTVITEKAEAQAQEIWTQAELEGAEVSWEAREKVPMEVATEAWLKAREAAQLRKHDEN